LKSNILKNRFYMIQIIELLIFYWEIILDDANKYRKSYVRRHKYTWT
jgi:hypothetical protein